MIRKPCFFDFASMKYVSLEGGFDDIDITNSRQLATEPEFPLARSISTLGLIADPFYPDDSELEKIPREKRVYPEFDAESKDDIYYKMSGGGITFGGGEPEVFDYIILSTLMAEK